MSNSGLGRGERHVIAPNTEVLGGLFHGSGAISVDFDSNPGPYEEACRNVQRLLARSRLPSILEIALAVNNVVRNTFPYSEQNVGGVLKAEAQARGLNRIGRDDEIGLSRFVGGGICHHQALFGGAIINLLQSEEKIGGAASIGMAPLDGATEAERHIWICYERDGQQALINPSDTPPVVMAEAVAA